MKKRFKDLGEREILALAVSLEEEHSRTYADYAESLKNDYPATAEIFTHMQQEESEHRRALIEEYRKRFGEHIPLIRREDVRGFITPRPVWLMIKLGINVMRRQADVMELETRRFYERAAAGATDAGIRKLLIDLAEAERKHSAIAESLEARHLGPDARKEEAATRRRLFVLQIVQPGLAGLMDGSISTLAPLFAVAFATRQDYAAFLAGLATSVGAGISMGFAEALSDDGSLTGRGHPMTRGVVCGLMTAGGGLGHTMPYLIPQFHTATSIAVVVVFFELMAISWIRYRFMDIPLWRSVGIVFAGGLLVFLAGVAIGLVGNYILGG